MGAYTVGDSTVLLQKLSCCPTTCAFRKLCALQCHPQAAQDRTQSTDPLDLVELTVMSSILSVPWLLLQLIAQTGGFVTCTGHSRPLNDAAA